MDVNEIKADLQLLGSNIQNLNIENSFVLIDFNDKDLKREIDVSYEISDPYLTEEEDESSIAANILLSIKLHIYNNEDSAKIGLNLEGCFVLNGDKDKDLLLKMLPVNGCAALYSIARGIVSSITSHMCFNGTILMPMINTYEFAKKSDSDIAENIE